MAKNFQDQPFATRLEHSGDTVIVRMSGSCTMNDAGKLTECMIHLVADGARLIVVDLAQLDFIESTGLGAIIAGHLRVRRHHGEVRLAAPSPNIHHLLELTRLTQLFHVFPSVEAALA